MPDSLLPHNATELERALEAASWRDVQPSVRSVWDPDTCPADMLPWLAWAFSVDQWDSSWSNDRKRRVIRNTIAVQRQKGTIGAVRDALGGLDVDVSVLEWHRQQIKGAPYTYKLNIRTRFSAPVSSLSLLNQVIRTVDRVKSLRSHLETTNITTSSDGGPHVAAAAFIGSDLTVTYGGQLT